MDVSTFPLAVRKSIRDNFDPYLPQFAEDTRKLFGQEWIAEANWAENLSNGGETFLKVPGQWMKNIFVAGVQQLQRYTKDGTDDMVVEAFQDAVPTKTIAVGIDDGITGYSGHAFRDGKLWLLFKSGKGFANNVGRTLDKVLDDL